MQSSILGMMMVQVQLISAGAEFPPTIPDNERFERVRHFALSAELPLRERALADISQHCSIRECRDLLLKVIRTRYGELIWSEWAIVKNACGQCPVLSVELAGLYQQSPHLFEGDPRIILEILAVHAGSDARIRSILEHRLLHTSDPRIRAQIQVVLANARDGCNTARQLCEEVRKHSEIGSAVVSMLAKVPASSWFDACVEELTKWLRTDADGPELDRVREDCGNAIKALGLMGKRAAKARSRLSELSGECPSVTPLCLYALASIENDLDQKRVLLRRSLVLASDDRLTSVLGIWLPESTAQIIFDMTRREDGQVLRGALLMIAARAPVETDRAARLLSIAENTRSSETFEFAVRGLWSAYDPLKVAGRLELLLTPERSESAREAIRETVSILRLELATVPTTAP